MKTRTIKVAVAGRMAMGTPAIRTIPVFCSLGDIDNGRHYLVARAAFENYTEGKAEVAIDEDDDPGVSKMQVDYEEIKLREP